MSANTMLKPSTAKLRKELLKLSKKELIKRCKKKKVPTNGTKADMINRYIKKVNKKKKLKALKMNQATMQLNNDTLKEINNKLQSMVPAYIRDTLQHEIPMGIILIIIPYLSATMEFKKTDNKLNLTFNEESMLASWFGQVLNLNDEIYTISTELLYESENGWISSHKYHKNCDGKGMIFTIIKTNYDHIFGLFLAVKTKYIFPNGQPGEVISDPHAFVCVIRSAFKHKLPKLFKVKDKSGSYVYSTDPEGGPIFNGAVTIDCDGDSIHFTQKNDRKWKGLTGNRLCGPTSDDETYTNSKKQWRFKIDIMQSFRIDINCVDKGLLNFSCGITAQLRTLLY